MRVEGAIGFGFGFWFWFCKSRFPFGKSEARFAKIASLLRQLPILCSQEEAPKSTLELITSQRSRNTLQQVIELSLSLGIHDDRIESTTLL